jgi:TolA-binding protein
MNHKPARFLLIGICFLALGISSISAQQKQDSRLVILSKQIIESASTKDLIDSFEELKDLYFKDNKYNEFLLFLGSLVGKKENLKTYIDYYTALGRYHQVKAWEEKKSWDEYFSKGEEYRDQMLKSAQEVIDNAGSKDPLYIYAKILLWQYHRDQQDPLQEELLSDLLNGIGEYSKEATYLNPIKDLADKLSSYEQKTKAASLYRIYVEKLISSGVKNEELKESAADFYRQGKLELAEALYDAYLERVAKVSPKDKVFAEIIDIARIFCYQDKQIRDPFYAEKLFTQAQDTSFSDAFDEGLIYLRAYNLEKSKEFTKAQGMYINLIKGYPDTLHYDEAEFKCGLISAYVLRDINSARNSFEKLAAREKVSPQVISSFYQLGLLSQWEGQPDKAKQFYNKLLEKSGDGFSDTVALVVQRLKEIEESKPIEYSLKTFLDVSFKEEYKNLDMSKLEIKPSLYSPNKTQGLEISSSVYQFAAGCMQVETQYLWSGHIGQAKSKEFSALDTNYSDSGTKEVNLVVVAPSGILDRSLDIVDVK